LNHPFKISQELNDDIQYDINEALKHDEEEVYSQLRNILTSAAWENYVLGLKDNEAENFMDLLREVSVHLIQCHVQSKLTCDTEYYTQNI